MAVKRSSLLIVLSSAAILFIFWPVVYHRPTDHIQVDDADPPKRRHPWSHTPGENSEQFDDSRVLGEKFGKTEHGSVHSKSEIDLDIAVPSVDTLYERLVLVTIFSSNHFEEGLGFIETAQKAMPNKTIVVFDIGFTAEQRSKVEALCDVSVRVFPFDSYPPHYKDLGTYAFKSEIMNMAVNEFGIIYYGDASIRFHKSVRELIPDALRHHGFVVHIRTFDPMLWNSDYALTVKEMYPMIGVNRTEVANSKLAFPCISSGLMLLINNTYLQENILKPWRACATIRECVAPPGASLANHRFDQSALTLIAYKNMYKEFTPEDDPTLHHESVVSIMRSTKASEYPKICNSGL